MKRTPLGLTVLAALLLSAGPSALGEIFVLTGGGQITGRWLNPDQSPRRNYVIETSSGGRITLAKSQVRQVCSTRPIEIEYERIRPNYPDTVEGQWELAQWCSEKRLTSQRRTHLERVIELDGDHAPARLALGYTQLGGGKWATQEQIMIARGYKLYKGRWRTSQEIELMETRRKTDNAEKDWTGKLRRWRNWLDTDRDPLGRKNILTMGDPHAVKALDDALQSDVSARARVLYVEALANIGTPAAIEAMAACSLEDPVEEVRLTCLDYLQKKKHPNVVAYFVGKLHDGNNRTINLAAVGLAQLKDPSAAGPLIDALVSTHTQKIRQGNPGSMTTTFGTGPGGSGVPGGLSVGGGVRTLTNVVQNQAVLDALVAITGENFNFDQQAWKYWYAMRRKHPTLDARRD